MSISSYNIFLEKKKKQEKGKLADAIYRNSTTFKKCLEKQLTKIDIDTYRMRRSLETNEHAFRNQLSIKHKHWLRELEKSQYKMYNYVYKRWEEEAADMQIKIEQQKALAKMRQREFSDSDAYSTASSEPTAPVQKKPLLLLAAATQPNTNLTQKAEVKPDKNDELNVSKIQLGLFKAKTTLGFQMKNNNEKSVNGVLVVETVNEIKEPNKIMKPILLYRPNQINSNESDSEDKDINSRKARENVKFAINNAGAINVPMMPTRHKSNVDVLQSNLLTARRKTFDSKMIPSNAVIESETITKLSENDFERSFIVKSKNSASIDKPVRLKSDNETSLTDQSSRVRSNSILKKPPALTARNDSVFSTSFYMERSKTNLSLKSGTDNQMTSKYDALKDDRFLSLVSSLEMFVKKERELPLALDSTHF